ncbi:Snf7 family protein [Colletotrichum karsti]|uniref:Snf7 family protein n=1 Tax=Colletotrichum karsti TaxID=1095194 RepID=A0A9P6HXJ8_9PEZI|nr:Snf7 family protein [Colletotrichum karsti]KAF9870126.1 Snf7 family protein [Colletotrichum karsti]
MTNDVAFIIYKISDGGFPLSPKVDARRRRSIAPRNRAEQSTRPTTTATTIHDAANRRPTTDDLRSSDTKTKLFGLSSADTVHANLPRYTPSNSSKAFEPLTMGGNASKVTAQDKAILDLKLQRDKLHQYQRRITVLTDKETAVAKQMLAKGDKPRALLALRRKKYQESLLQKTDAQLEQLEKLTSSVEFAMIQKDVVFGLQQGTKVLKEIHSEMGGIEHVEKLMGETADAIAYQKEVSDMLGGRISNQDEEEVEDELAALEASVAAEEAIRNPPKQHKLPTVPDTEPVLPEEPEPEPEAQEPARVRQAMLAS